MDLSVAHPPFEARKGTPKNLSFTLSLLSSGPKVTFSFLFRYFEFFGVSGSVGPFAPHNFSLFCGHF